MAPPPAAELMAELLGEIFIRLPPSEPEHLFRAALVLQGLPPVRFASTTSMPDFPHPGADSLPLDCRHGRVLVRMLEDETMDLLVWDPITGDKHSLCEPDIDWIIYSAAVICAQTLSSAGVLVHPDKRMADGCLEIRISC
ncbi:unnamed protein product [Urochloa humidicola]